MRTVRIKPNYAAWRAQARGLLNEKTSPEGLLWEDGSSGSDSLFEELRQDSIAHSAKTMKMEVRVPRAFMHLAELVACHDAMERWGLLYRVAWRLTHGKERQLLALRLDADVKRLEDWASAVRRDRHKMKAFVRFRKVGESDEGREQFVAWFEPQYSIVDLTAPFFAKRFANLEWSILTPRRCAHWNGDSLTYTAGVSSREAPKEDRLEHYWRSYYAHIFNPARLKLKAMQSEMPKKYWKNLPEAPLIAELTRKASSQTNKMVEAPASSKVHVSSRVPLGVPQSPRRSVEIDPADFLDRADTLSLHDLSQLGQQCRACPLHERATQVVFGEGPSNAAIMIVGEQPGDAEDLAGRPFVGPSGTLLNDALTSLGIDRQQVYVTNTVKHFKWKRQGKRRLHQTPKSDEIEVCRHWVLAEILKVQPKVLICLGATAAKSLIHPNFSIRSGRGLVPECRLAERVIVTIHPSYLLRLPQGEEREREFSHWITDLALTSESS